MFLKFLQAVGNLIAKWGIAVLVGFWTYELLFHPSATPWSSSGAAYIYVAALFGVSSIASRHEKQLLNVAYQVFAIGVLSHFALLPDDPALGAGTIKLAVAACVAFVALMFFLLSFPTLLATSPRIGPQKELATRIYRAVLGALLVALPVGGALPYVVYASGTPGAAARVGWSPYGYALFFVAVFSGTLAILLVPPVKSLPRPRFERWQRFLPWPVGAFLLWGAIEVHLRGRGWTIYLLSLITFVGTCVTVYRALQLLKIPQEGQTTVSKGVSDIPSG